MKLEGIRVLDLSRFLPGPHLAMMMADHGADVIKVEDPRTGDPARAIGPRKGEHTVYFRNANRGKRSLAVDLKSDDGREAFLRLAKTADVILETFRPGVVGRLGIGYEAVRDRAPQVVYASISAFGQSGPYRDRPAHDLSVNALAGVASLSVDADGKPAMACLPPSDMGGSLMTLAGILMALLRRQSTGRGDYLDLAMFDTVVSWTAHVAGRVFADGRAPDPASERTQGGGLLPPLSHQGRSLRHAGRRRDEVRRQLPRRRGLARPDPARLRARRAGAGALPRLPRGDLRAAHAGRVGGVVRRPRHLCFAPVLDLREAFDDLHLAAREMVRREAGGPAHLGIPIKFREEPGRIGPDAQALGAHSSDILREIGYGETRNAGRSPRAASSPRRSSSGGLRALPRADQADDLRRGLHVAEVAVEILDGVGVAAGRHRSARVLRHQAAKVEIAGEPDGALDAAVGEDAADHDGGDPLYPQQVLQVSGGEDRRA